MTTADAQWRGVFTIPVTPFHEDGSIDWDSLRRCVEFCIEAGAHGIVMPVNASEFFTLTDDERGRSIRSRDDGRISAARHRTLTCGAG